ncbi:uncharacterized protein MYCFIDRAFT_172588 [Pseudocercospora fijiensis CIRAD86]|uniref:Uncharacterized protein n=1 Tax=Pseudocercospora fijiensis (strain CIRAD86) TaxID=383855 RepID=M3A730_PSEFD|nr:uncharacterized protein MYCFIDRAFT_172588 [Pseudocercospora fijiensis CIRAD86]EME86894.1 hypothetical protein MYCFIDRAFT_172588 [Pseudocercospora fijiensis CIRAD86]
MDTKFDLYQLLHESPPIAVELQTRPFLSCILTLQSQHPVWLSRSAQPVMSIARRQLSGSADETTMSEVRWFLHILREKEEWRENSSRALKFFSIECIFFFGSCRNGPQ